jgi:hypothetical protein
MDGATPTFFSGSFTKLDSNYNVVWSFAIDSVTIVDAAETNDGNYWFFGYPNSGPYFLAPHLIKVSPAGRIKKAKTFYWPNKSSNSFRAQGICKAAGADTGLVMYGMNVAGERYLMKLDTAANVQWATEFTVNGTGGAITSLITDGDYYVGGFSYADSTSIQQSGIFKADTAGNFIWNEILYTTIRAYIAANSIVKKDNGNYFVMTRCIDTLQLQNYTLNNSGNVLNATKLVCPGSDCFTPASASSCQNGNNEILIPGRESNITTGIGMIVKLDSTDSPAYSKFTESSDNLSYAVPLQNGLYGVGFSWSGKTLAMIDENGNGFCSSTPYTVTVSPITYSILTPTVVVDTFSVLSVDNEKIISAIIQTGAVICDGIADVNNQSALANAFVVYPNPVNTILNIASPEKIKTISFINVVGRVEMKIEKVNSTTASIDITNLVQGIYLLQVTCGSEILTKKIVKE